VRQGQSFVVTSHGRPVARIVPATTNDAVVQSARAALFERLSAARARSIGRWTREELYERGSQ
jgi:antitoxin (DNA-binding transcriptional repressor) of toxin-antitoxin stability system